MRNTEALPPPHNALSPAEYDCLRLIARLMIPPSEEFGLPGADDTAIVQRVLQLLDRDAALFKRTILDVTMCAGSPDVPLTTAELIAQIDGLRQERPADFAAIESAVARAYYSDDRVMKSIGMALRAPFPVGYEIDPITDWSILEPVKQRGPAYRRVVE